MHLINKTVHQSKITKWNHYFLGDWHYPTLSFDMENCKKIVKHIAKDDHALVYLLGDMAECISIDDRRRFDADTILPEARNHLHDMHLYCLDEITKILEPIAGKVVVIVEGNHEDTLRKTHEVDFCWRLRDNLRMAQGIKRPAWPVFGGDMAMVRTVYTWDRGGEKAGTAQTRWLMSHGYGASRTKGAKINRLMEMSYIMPECDGFFMAHHHDKLTDRLITLGVRMGHSGGPMELYEKKHLLGITGSAYRTYHAGTRGNYASKRLYRPADLGCIFAEVSPFKGQNKNKIILDIRDLVLE